MAAILCSRAVGLGGTTFDNFRKKKLAGAGAERTVEGRGLIMIVSWLVYNGTESERSNPVDMRLSE